MTLALVLLEPHDGAGLACDVRRSVGAVVVVDVDVDVGHRGLEVLDDLADSDRLVVTRDDGGNPRRHGYLGSGMGERSLRLRGVPPR
jgi:hypothetical protein